MVRIMLLSMITMFTEKTGDMEFLCWNLTKTWQKRQWVDIWQKFFLNVLT